MSSNKDALLNIMADIRVETLLAESRLKCGSWVDIHDYATAMSDHALALMETLAAEMESLSRAEWLKKHHGGTS